jgi:hypothetical protein
VGKLDILFKAMESAMNSLGLFLKLSKCRILKFDDGKHVPCPGVKLGKNKSEIPDAYVKGTKFLGCDLPASLDPKKVGKIVKETMELRLDAIDVTFYPFHAKVYFYERLVIGVLRWYFTIYNKISQSTVEELTKMTTRYLKVWFGCYSKMTPHALYDPAALGITRISDLWAQCRVIGIQKGLMSKDENVRNAALKAKSSNRKFNRGIREDLKNISKRMEALQARMEIAHPGVPWSDEEAKRKHAEKEQLALTMKELDQRRHERLLKHFTERKTGTDFWTSCPSPKLCKEFRLALSGLQPQELLFAVSAIAESLPVGASYAYFTKKVRVVDGETTVPATNNTNCPLCSAAGLPPARQTLKHVLNTCQVALHGHRFTTRHDAVLKVLVDGIKEFSKFTLGDVWFDLPTCTSDRPHYIVDHHSQRPDIFVRSEDDRFIWLIELTVSFEGKSTSHSHSIKDSKYAALAGLLQADSRTRHAMIFLWCVEIGSRGRINESLMQLDGLLTRDGARRTRRMMSVTAIRGSEHIYKNRNSTTMMVN